MSRLRGPRLISLATFALAVWLSACGGETTESGAPGRGVGTGAAGAGDAGIGDAGIGDAGTGDAGSATSGPVVEPGPQAEPDVRTRPDQPPSTGEESPAPSEDEPVIPDNWCGTGVHPDPIRLGRGPPRVGLWSATQAKGVYRRTVTSWDSETQTSVRKMEYGRRLNGAWVVWPREAEWVRRALEAKKPGSAPLPPSVKVPGRDTPTKPGEWLPMDGAGIYVRTVCVVGPNGKPQYRLEYRHKVDGKWETWISPIGWLSKPDERPRKSRKSR